MVRHEWHLLVQESIKIEVSADRSLKPEGLHSLILSTRITNLNQIIQGKTVTVTPINAALVSNNWTLENNFIIPENIKMQCQESVCILLKANKKISEVSTYSEVCFEKINFMDCFEMALLDFSKRDEASKLNVFDDLENLDTAEKKAEAVFVLRWHAEIMESKGHQRTLYGQNKIPLKVMEKEIIINNGQKITPFHETRYDFEIQKLMKKDVLRPLRNQIKYNIQYIPITENDFETNGIHLVSIKVLLHNLVEYTSDVTIKAVLGEG